MVIGIDASRAFLRNRTGIEEYSYRLIRHLRVPLRDERVVLYVRSGQMPDFELPASWRIRVLRAPWFWTHIRLSIEMLLRRPDVLFIPAHTVPCVHPRRSVVTVHGLEYEFSQEGYSPWERLYMRFVIGYSCRVAETVIAVSENTKHDLMRLYRVPQRKIRVIYEGKPTPHPQADGIGSSVACPVTKPDRAIGKPYLLFVGRIEERKNVRRIVEAFDMLKKDRGIPHRLILAGKPGYGYPAVKRSIEASEYRDDIVEKGYVSESEKRMLLSEADVFVFPSLYEGFGLPIVEAQTAGVPVVTSNCSSMPEIGGEGSLYADPLSVESIAERIWDLLSGQVLRSGILEKGRTNAERFDWEKCAEEVADVLRR